MVNQLLSRPPKKVLMGKHTTVLRSSTDLNTSKYDGLLLWVILKADSQV